VGAVPASNQACAPKELRLQALEGRHRHAFAHLAQEDGPVRFADTLAEILKQHRAEDVVHRQYACLCAFAPDGHLSQSVVGAPVQVPAVQPDQLALAEAATVKRKQERPLTCSHLNAQERLEIIIWDRSRLQLRPARLLHLVNWISRKHAHPDVAREQRR